MDREQLYDAFTLIQVRWQFCFDCSSRRGYEKLIESVAHELAHAIELRLSPPATNAKQEAGSSMINRAIKESGGDWEQDGHELRALAIEASGLRELGYRVRVHALAKQVVSENMLRMSRSGDWVEASIRRRMEDPKLKALVAKFVRMVEKA